MPEDYCRSPAFLHFVFELRPEDGDRVQKASGGL
jgi:hypothetical protein